MLLRATLLVTDSLEQVANTGMGEQPEWTTDWTHATVT